VLSVKIRAGTALEVKVYRGSPGILDIASRARGRIESWQKWSFPCKPLSWDGGGPADWRPVALVIVVAVVLHVALPAKYRINPPWVARPCCWACWPP
jgi:hypothetical protein